MRSFMFYASAILVGTMLGSAFGIAMVFTVKLLLGV